jgi:hypothetical protein
MQNKIKMWTREYMYKIADMAKIAAVDPVVWFEEMK